MLLRLAGVLYTEMRRGGMIAKSINFHWKHVTHNARGD